MGHIHVEYGWSCPYDAHTLTKNHDSVNPGVISETDHLDSQPAPLLSDARRGRGDDHAYGPMPHLHGDGMTGQTSRSWRYQEEKFAHEVRGAAPGLSWLSCLGNRARSPRHCAISEKFRIGTLPLTKRSVVARLSAPTRCRIPVIN